MWKAILLPVLLATPLVAAPVEQTRTLSELEEALQDEALRPAALVEITRLYNATEEYEKGVVYGEQAIEALPESSAAHLEYARALKIKLNRISRMKGALVIGAYKRELRRALELDPDSVAARVEEIGFFIHAPAVIGGSAAVAQERIDNLKRLAWREAMLMQAELQRKQADPEGALRTYDEMIAHDPQDAEALRRRALVLQSDKKDPETGHHFQTPH